MGRDFEEIRDRVAAREITIAGRRYYVAEGDLLLDDGQLIEYAQRRAAANQSPDRAPAGHSFLDRKRRLLAGTRNGRIVRWRNPLSLTYRIDVDSFANDAQRSMVRTNLRHATQAWSEACGVAFEEQVDEGATPLFRVWGQDTGGDFIAVAFFPTDPPERRFMIVDPTYFEPLDYDRVGVFRHELGHVLGLQHEHIRANFEDCDPEPLEDTQAVTDYDSQSVMHYLCEGVGSKMLELTDVDREGARTIYGPPLQQFDLVEA